MIKKLSVLAIACITASLNGQTNSAWLEIKPGYFFFANHTLRKIYHGGFEIQGSVTYPINGTIAWYSSIGYIHNKGKSLGDTQKTSISQVPLDLGFRAMIDVSDSSNAYLSAGPRFFYFHQRNDSDFVPKNVRTNGFGFFVNGGYNFINTNGFLFGVFGEYAFEQKSFTSTMPNVQGKSDLQVGGFTFGASIGFEF
jgi:hypothetical protein